MGSRGDGDLVRAVLDGDTAAFAALYDRYAPLVRAVCHDATRNVHDAQDLAQEVFLRGFRRLRSLRHPDRFAAWIIGITRHVCREWRRGAWQTRRDRWPAEPVKAGDPVPDDEAVRRLHQSLLGLPEKERLAIHAFYLLDRSAEQARRVVGLSRSGFYRCLERAKRRLRRVMAEDSEMDRG